MYEKMISGSLSLNSIQKQHKKGAAYMLYIYIYQQNNETRQEKSMFFFSRGFETSSTYLQCEVELLLTVSLVVQALFQPQGAALFLFVTHHVELLLLVSCHNTKGQLGIFSRVPVLCSKL